MRPEEQATSETLYPGQAYAVYSATDILGTVPEDYEVIVRCAARWTGVDEEVVHSVVETLERRLVRWGYRLEQDRKAELQATSARVAANQ